MATLHQAKILGGLGAILVLIPFVSLIGYILIIVAVKEISDDLHDRAIFSNVVVAAVTGIVGAIAGAIVIVVGLVGGAFTSGLAGVVAGLLIGWVFLIISALFLRRAYNVIGQRLGVGAFRTAATLYLVGSVLTIVLVGFVVLFVAQIMAAIAYFSMPDQPPAERAGGFPPPSAPQPSAQPTTGATKFCTSCGAKISTLATFCYNCGAKQQ